MTVLLQDYVVRQAERRPDSVALVMDERRLTYGQLEDSSNRLARVLVEVGCRAGDRICLFLPKSPTAVLSMIAALKAQGVYVPIDVTSPPPRIEKIVRSAQPRVVLADESATKILDELVALDAFDRGTVIASAGDERLTGVNFESTVSGQEWAQVSAEPMRIRGSSDDAAHILFTSGSTGVPKGVVITHANVAHFVEWATKYFGTSAADRISGHPPLHFDLSTFDIYGTFLAGAELHLVPQSANLLPHKLAEFIRRSELTQWFAVPSVFSHMMAFDAVRQRDFPTVRRVLWCGEVLPTPVLRYWMDRLPHAVFTNLYGPTEATIASSYCTVPQAPTSDVEQIPIGTACAGEELIVLDERLDPVPPGVSGDLYIGGVGLSPGYWRDEEQTRAAFVADPWSPDPSKRIYKTGDLARVGADGLLYFLGRSDSQIKHRGYRIELGEIESAVNALELVGECAVVGVEADGLEGTAICCAYAPAPGTDVDGTALRKHLRNVLPAYMLPTRWLTLDELPKNVNGKIDRRKLKELFQEQTETRSTATFGRKL